MNVSIFRIALIVIGVTVAGYGDMLFEDNFTSRDEWVSLFGQGKERIEEGNYVIDNEGEGICAKKHSADFSTFSYTVSFKPLEKPLKRAGVLFCWNDVDGGYEFSIDSSQQYTLSKYEPVGAGRFQSVILARGYHTFIDRVNTNVITVNKSGNDISLICNDAPLTQCTDHSFESGDIGLVVHEGDEVSFDFVRVTDQPLQAAARESFSDDFDDGDVVGWRKLTSSGSFENTGSALNITGVDTFQTIVYSDGSYKNAPVRVIVKKEGGPDNSFYGLALLSVSLEPAENNGYYQKHDGLFFTISGNRQWGVYRSNTTFQPGSSTHIHGTRDTLVITNDHHFMINGHTLQSDNFGDDLDFNAVALVCGANVSVTFDDFSVGTIKDSPILKRARNIYVNRLSDHRRVGNYHTIFDVRGRTIARVSAENDLMYKNKRGAGAYLRIEEVGEIEVSVMKSIMVK